MENFDVMLVPLRGILTEIGNFLPRLGSSVAQRATKRAGAIGLA